MKITKEQDRALQVAAGNRYYRICDVLGLETAEVVSAKPTKKDNKKDSKK